MRYFMFCLRFPLLLLPLLSIYNIQLPLSLPLSNSFLHLCNHEDATALLRFIRDFVINRSASKGCADNGQIAYPKIRSWNYNTDCCSWDGVACDSLSGHVIELDLSCSQIRGTINSNSTLFQLQTLQSLNLAFNNFYNSIISPKFGQFPHLKLLNLSSTTFTGKVPIEIAKLSHLISLHISSSYHNHENKLEMSDLGLIMMNMTDLKELLLKNIFLNSVMPQSLVNLSSLTSLTLSTYGLRGNFPTDILHLPHLRSLHIEDDGLHANFSGFGWTSPLEELALSSTHFIGKLPEPARLTQFPRQIFLFDSNFHGVIPSWVWNVTEVIYLSSNQLSGELPSLVNTSKLFGIKKIYLMQNMLSGKIPSWVFTLPSLEDLDLSENQFNGQLAINNCVNISRSLQFLDLSSNIVHGLIPTSISKLESLQYLSLRLNKLNGTIDFSMFFQLQRLQYLTLSNNNLSLSFGETSTLRPQFYVLGLSSCNLDKFPDFLMDQKYLVWLELPENKIHGQLPRWLLEKTSLLFLDISYNYLTGGLEHIPWNKLETFYQRFGLSPHQSSQVHILSNNRFTGEIPSTICNLSASLEYLDLSNNSLAGRIPRCLGNLSDQLVVLNLSLNKFNGTLPQDFIKCRSLKYLDVNTNQLEGTIPPSLGNCSRLKVLDLGNNKLSGRVPHWLVTLTELQVLVLRSNSLHGLLIELDGQSLFPKLQKLDIANNQFSGNLSCKLIKSLKSMMNKEVKHEEQYISEESPYSGGSNYTYSITFTFKGSERRLDKVPSNLANIDVSCNKFEGDIPDEISYLVSLRWLNLSYNHFNGTIPPSLGNLSLLESLDFSSNELVGQIPMDLGRLTYLEYFNASRNKLVGPIPVGNQFDTFGNESYINNPGLCGTPLSKKCADVGGGGGDDEDDDDDNDDTMKAMEFGLCETILMGYGSGIVVGLSIGYFVVWGKMPLWLLRLICEVEFIMEHRFKRQRRS